MQMNIWQVLEIEPTINVRNIKKAYAKLTRKFHVEDNPEKFRIIHEAYQLALDFAKGNDEIKDSNVVRETKIIASEFVEDKYGRLLVNAKEKYILEKARKEKISDKISQGIKTIKKLDHSYAFKSEWEKHRQLFLGIKDESLFINMLIALLQNEKYISKRTINYFYDLYDFNNMNDIKDNYLDLYNVLKCIRKDVAHQTSLLRYFLYSVALQILIIGSFSRNILILFTLLMLGFEAVCKGFEFKNGLIKSPVKLHINYLYSYIWLVGINISILILAITSSEFEEINQYFAYIFLFIVINFGLLWISIIDFVKWNRMKKGYFFDYILDKNELLIMNFFDK